MLAARQLAVGLSLARVVLPARLGSSWARVLVVAALATPASVVLVPADAFWERAHPSIVAYVGLVVALVGWNAATGRAWAVRGWIVVGFAAWTLLHLLKNVEYAIPLPITPDVLLVVLTVAAGGAYRADLVGRMPWREQFAVYLDAAVVTATASAALIVWLGGGAFADAQLTTALVYAIVFVGIMSATVILDLALLAELKPRGAYVLLVGIGGVAAGFIGQGLSGPGSTEHAFAGWLISASVVLIAYGTATWNDIVDDRPRYVAVAATVRKVLPLAAVVLMPVLLISPLTAVGGPGTIAVQGLAAFALVGVAVRQSLLLQEREGMLGGLSAARGAAERRTQQIAGLEAVGRLLAAAGPTDEVLRRVIEVIFERFGYAHVAVYVADGQLLRLGAQRGYRDLFPTLDGTRGVVGRVMRTRRPELVREVLADPDYLMADPAMGSEICAPLLDGGEFLGILDVESADYELDETDLAAVVAVADQLAGAMALALRRQRLLLERNFTSALLDTVAAVIVVTDAKGRVVRFNPACSEVSGYSTEELQRLHSFSFLVPVESRAAVEAVVNEVQSAGVARNTENDWVRKDGVQRRISWSNRPLLDEQGNVEFVLATGIDITERKQLEDQLAHRALHDPLTALPNRALLMDRLEHALKRQRVPTAVGVLFVDLDRFKLINDTLGHEAGDQVLVRVARQLSASLRPEDTAARVGGDEFAAVLEGVHGPDDAVIIAERVREAIGALRIEVRGTPVTVAASVGVAIGSNDTHEAGELLRNADIAMYSAKTGGRARTAVFRNAMYATMVEQRDIERMLSVATAQGEVLLHYQPIFRLADRHLVGAEALARWSHPTRGLLWPAEFLGVAETTGMIVPIGAHVVREACQQMAQWIARDALHAPEWMSVNVSPRQFADPQFEALVRQALDEAGLDPARLMIEITESVMVEMTESTTSMLASLRALGIRFAIDDFGSGYSGLSYLHRLPIDLLKIDRSFIAGVDVESKQLAFVSALIAMGETLGLKVLAEGIETATQYQAVRRLGCELGQGHYLGRPVLAEELMRSAA